MAEITARTSVPSPHQVEFIPLNPAGGSADPIHDEVLPRLDGVKPGNGGYMARCPVHDDRSPSLSIRQGRVQPVLLTCHGCGADAKTIADAAGIPWAAITARRESGPQRSGIDAWMPCGHTKVAEYEYRDQHGGLVFAVARCSEKGKTCQGFRQWRPDPTSKSGRKWSRTLPDGTKVGDSLPYRLPELLAADPVDVVYIVEGEKDANLIWSLGMPATCNAEGAGKWTKPHAEWLRGRDIIVVADRDGPGEKHAITVVNSLWDLARSIDIAQAVNGKDASDHIAAGGTLGSLNLVYTAKTGDRTAPA